MSDKYLHQLHQAIVAGKNARALDLINRPGMKDYVNKKIGLGTCLHLVCINNNVEVCQALLDVGADTAVRETYGGTPLHMASDKGHIDCVRLLVTSGADVTLTCSSGYTAYSLANLNGHKNVAKFLGQKMGIEEMDSATGEVASSTCKASSIATGKDPYGFGYQNLNERLTEIQGDMVEKICDVGEKVQEVQTRQNDFKEDLEVMKEQLGKLEIEKKHKKKKGNPCGKQYSRGPSFNSEAAEMADRVQKNFRKFVDSIVASDVLDGLFEKKALTLEEVQVIDSIAANGQKTRELLMMLLRKKDPCWAFALHETLTESDTGYNQDLAKILESDVTEL